MDHFTARRSEDGAGESSSSVSIQSSRPSIASRRTTSSTSSRKGKERAVYQEDLQAAGATHETTEDETQSRHSLESGNLDGARDKGQDQSGSGDEDEDEDEDEDDDDDDEDDGEEEEPYVH